MNKAKDLSKKTETPSQKPAGEIFLENEKYYQLIVEHMPLLLGVIDSCGKIRAWNKYGKKMLGYGPEDVIDKMSVFALTKSEEEAEEVMRLAMEKGVYDNEINFVHKKRNLIPVHLVIFSHKDEKGRIDYFYGFAEDITKRKLSEDALNKAHEELEVRVQKRTLELARINVALQEEIAERKKIEAALRKNEEHYRLLAENITDVIWTADLNLRFTYFSPSIKRLLGYTVQEALEKNVSEIITPGSFDLAFKTLKEELAEEKKKDKDLARSKRIELEHIHKDGNVFWVEVTVTFTRDADGKATGVLGVCREISRRKKIEDALRESEERFRSLVECASDWIWEVDENAKYTYASPKVKDILGYEPQEVLGKTPFDLMPPGERERIRSLYTSVVKTKKAFECLENTNVRKDGKIVVLETSGVPIFDAKGKFRGYRGIDRDITERKKTESKSSR